MGNEADDEVARRDGVDRIVRHGEAGRAQRTGDQVGQGREHPLGLRRPVRRPLQHAWLRSRREVAAREQLADQLTERGQAAQGCGLLVRGEGREPGNRLGEGQSQPGDRPQGWGDARWRPVFFLDFAFGEPGHRSQGGLLDRHQQLQLERLQRGCQLGWKPIPHALDAGVGPEGDPRVGGETGVKVGGVQD